jgi:hypothetical protein
VSISAHPPPASAVTPWPRWHPTTPLVNSWVWIAAIVGSTLAARLTVLRVPLTPDEAGFLMVAGQWRPGQSLYGDYWVDRPPLLIDFYELAAASGGASALRLIGLLVAAVAVIAGASAGRRAARFIDSSASTATVDRAGVAAAAVVGICVANPLFDSFKIGGELIGIPFVLVGVALAIWALALAGTSVAPAQRAILLFGSGAAGAAAALLKQNQIDVFVFALALSCWAPRLPSRAGRARDLGWVLIGALALTALVCGHAAWKGTGPRALWDAIVTFRFEAGHVIAVSASEATHQRLMHLLMIGAVTGIPLLMVCFATCWHNATATQVALYRSIGLLLVWELVAIGAGGSYWLAYLLGLVPGLALAAAYAVVARGPSATPPSAFARPARSRLSARRVLPALLGYAGLTSLVAVGSMATGAVRLPTEEPVVNWLIAHAEPGDTAVVAYGHANVLYDAGLSSPYQYLWSLPVRVRDPDLVEFSAVLAGSQRPDFVITRQPGLPSWGIDARQAQGILRAHYALATEIGGQFIYERRDERGAR